MDACRLGLSAASQYRMSLFISKYVVDSVPEIKVLSDCSTVEDGDEVAALHSVYRYSPRLKSKIS
jgi:hypothetical protein